VVPDKRVLGIFESKKKILALACDHCFSIARGIADFCPEFCAGTFDIHPFLK
jgi:hypothetical protein